MDDRPRAPQEPPPDATDVITGPVGSARLVDPAHDPDAGADLHELPDAVMPSPTPEPDEGDLPDRGARPAAPDDTAQG